MKAKQKLTRISVALALILNLSCVHTRTDETRAVQNKNSGSLESVTTAETDLQYVIYRPSQLPLGQFFTHLRKGDYKKAFQKIDIRYKPANYDDEILTELIDAGFVPVYVKIKNTSTAPLQIDEKSFALNHSAGEVKAFNTDQLPRKFEEFSPTALAANVYNTGVVVVGFAAIMGLVIISAEHGGSSAFPTIGANDFAGGGGSSSNDEIYNSLYKNVHIDFKNYLITRQELSPGQEAKGLLFFYVGNADLESNSKLVFR